MCVDEHGCSGEMNAPPPMEESWWKAVLADEQKIEDNEIDGTQPEYHSHRMMVEEGCEEDWQWARALYACDDTVELSVVGFNRGGLLVEANKLRGFIPLSHITGLSGDESEFDRGQLLSEYVGDTLQLKIIELDPERGRLVFSQRAATAGPGRRIELLNTLAPDMKVSGKVTNITQFGVFVDLGGVEGLIHVSELSWGRVRHPRDVVDCGQELEVKVLSVDVDQGRVALSLKELLPDPWAEVDQRYDVGEIVEGLVTNVVKFGAFVGIEEGLEGLIHVSELGEGSFLHPRSVLVEGEKVRVRIIHIDAAERRLGLSIRGIPQTDMDEDVVEKPIIQRDVILDP
ncbi:MAG: S1 RNA-binding domain-containing protein [Anaerolineales bacterium]|nr:S1 RNA-binding domain-containing protein [Anaerolineales bacterium]